MSSTFSEAFRRSTTPTARTTLSLAGVRSVPPLRRLQVVLGLVWLVDAALQYQPYMFGRTFVTQTIEPAAVGTPSIVEHPSLWAAHFMIHHITVYNSLFATLQLLIALALFFRPTVKVGLAVSIVWALGIWWLAEGIGGITAGASPFAGAPGATIVYAFIAVLLWPRANHAAGSASVAESGPLGRLTPKLVWAVLWVGLAALGLENANRSPSALHDLVTGMSPGEPAWVKTLNRGLAAPLAHHGTEWSIGFAVLSAVVGLGVFVPRAIRPVLVVAVLVGVAVWLVEDFGEIPTGSATDVNSGPLLMLLAACFWPTTELTDRRTAGGGAAGSDAVASSR